MKEIQLNTTITVFNSLEELPAKAQLLMQEAIKARKNAYAPYSKFRVGAALSLDNSKVVTGNNQENACYPSGLCAERVAIYQAGAQYPNKTITMLAITAASETYTVEKPAPPCGACRQAIAEYEFKQKQPIEIYFMGETGQILYSKSLTNLLPLSFDKDFLG
jgi:cytidine deaminase